MSFGDRLRTIRIKYGYTQLKIAEFLGYGSTTVNGYEKGGSKPNLDAFISLCNLFKVDANYFLQDDIPCNSVKDSDYDILRKYRELSDSDRELVDFLLNRKKQVEQTKIYMIPVYKQEAAAGSGQYGFDQFPDMESHRIAEELPEFSFAMRISGSSMECTDTEKSIPDGSLVLVRNVEDNDTFLNEAVIANINGEIVCKEYCIEEDGRVCLKSRNRNECDKDRLIHKHDKVKIIGRVVKVILA